MKNACRACKWRRNPPLTLLIAPNMPYTNVLCDVLYSKHTVCQYTDKLYFLIAVSLIIVSIKLKRAQEIWEHCGQRGPRLFILCAHKHPQINVPESKYSIHQTTQMRMCWLWWRQNACKEIKYYLQIIILMPLLKCYL